MLRDLLSDAASEADDELLSRVYAAVSVPSEFVREVWRRAGWDFVDPGFPAPQLPRLDVTAGRVVRQAATQAAAVGGVAGLGGVVFLPPEILAHVVAVVRLGQRLCLVYGFDPETDRGRMALSRALAAGLDVDLPEQGAVRVRVRDLPWLMVHPAQHNAVGELGRQLLWRTARLVVGRVVGRAVPVVSSGVGAWTGRRRMLRVGARMSSVLRRLAEAPGGTPTPVEDAVEVA